MNVCIYKYYNGVGGFCVSVCLIYRRDGIFRWISFYTYTSCVADFDYWPSITRTYIMYLSLGWGWGFVWVGGRWLFDGVISGSHLCSSHSFFSAALEFLPLYARAHVVSSSLFRNTRACAHPSCRSPCGWLLLLPLWLSQNLYPKCMAPPIKLGWK